ncbi:hypothetical protein MHYP_G00340660 [Metynnis hypsauchen]
MAFLSWAQAWHGEHGMTDEMRAIPNTPPPSPRLALEAGEGGREGAFMGRQIREDCCARARRKCQPRPYQLSTNKNGGAKEFPLSYCFQQHAKWPVKVLEKQVQGWRVGPGRTQALAAALNKSSVPAQWSAVRNCRLQKYVFIDVCRELTPGRSGSKVNDL